MPLYLTAVTIPDAELRWRFSRSSGPGGQHVNTSDTAAELSFDVAASPTLPSVLRRRALDNLAHRLADGVLTVRAEEFRSQLRNREAAADRMTALLNQATKAPPKPRKKTRPSRGAVQRRLSEKARRGQTKKMRKRPADE